MVVEEEGATVANTNAGSSSALRDDLVCVCVCVCVCIYVCERAHTVGGCKCMCLRNERDVRNAVEKEDNTLNPESLLL